MRPSRGRGQNFMVRAETAARIVRSCAASYATAFEIGPGLGVMTAALIDRARHVVAVEIDRVLAGHIRRRFESPRPGCRFDLMEADALDVDWRKAIGHTPEPRVVFGNLPYSVSASILEKIFQHADMFSEAILCVQAEVADRIISPGGRSMGPITLLAYRFCAKREKVFTLGPGAFHPKPKISSTVIRLVLRQGVRWTELDRRIPRILFAHRRKVISSVDRTMDWGEFASRRIDELPIEAADRLARMLYDRAGGAYERYERDGYERDGG